MDPPSGSDEGEIIESEQEKATTSLPSVNGTSVDRPSRTRVPASKASEGYEASRSYQEHLPPARRDGSPPRGEKRSHDADYGYSRRGGGGGGYDSRHMRAPREDRSYDQRRRSRVSYADLDYVDPSEPHLRYDERDAADDRYQYKRPRTRSRSPGRPSRSDYRRARREHPEHDSYRRGSADRRRSRDYSRGAGWSRHHDARYESGQRQSRPSPSTGHHEQRPKPARPPRGEELSAENGRRTETASPEKPPEEDAQDVREPEPLDEASLIEERRKRREAIKAKYKGQAPPLLVQALRLDNTPATESPSTPMTTSDSQPQSQLESPRPSGRSSPKDEAVDAGVMSPTDFTVTKDEELVNQAHEIMSRLEQDQPSAADYNPTMDMREDHMRNDKRHHADDAVSGNDATGTGNVEVLAAAEALPPQERQKKDDFDMFADDDDMFAEQALSLTADADREQRPATMTIPQIKELDMSLVDDWDDHEGYYRVLLGEMLEGRYHVQANLGKGMFSGVVRALDSKDKKLVAIKIIRSNETMKKAGIKEIEILQKLIQADPDDKKHLIRLERHFEHKGHLCMVFENLSINLREVLRKFGRDVGINLKAVRAYAQQIFLGLSLLRKCNLLHADLKPDNILVNEARNYLKICDLGSASDMTENEITPYLVSRFYRAPEIILGLPYDFAIDVWSVGCTLYELYTGKILFTGRTNNQMLRSIMECRGKFSHKMLRRAQFAGLHFDDLLNFKSVERDKLTGKDTVRVLNFTKPVRDLKMRLLPATKGMTEAEVKEVHLFIDLLDRCLSLNPERRCTPLEALKHPFISRPKG